MTIQTAIWRISIEQQCGGELDADQPLQEAARLLGNGAVVAFPTETVYGLGADARNSEAVARIFAAKGRPSDNPLIVHIADKQQLEELVLPYPALAVRLMDAFWPGPLTIVLPVQAGKLSKLVTAGLDTVGIRIPDHPAALSLIRQAGCPVAAPSANRSGKPSPTTAEHVKADLAGRIDGIVDCGSTGVGLESTVVELVTPHTIRILRPGGITEEQIRLVAGDAFIESALTVSEPNCEQNCDEAPRSPGMKYAHYAPDGQMQLVDGTAANVAVYINKAVAAARGNGQRTAVLAFDEHLDQFDADVSASLGSIQRLEQGANRLYAALRYFDQEGVEQIWSECCVRSGIGEALMNRMMKAAGNNKIYV